MSFELDNKATRQGSDDKELLNHVKDFSIALAGYIYNVN